MILSIHNVSKRFAGEKVPAVDNVSIEVGKGEIVALLGESGSGKTTLLRLVAGFEKPSSGNIFINGKKVAGNELFTAPEKRGIGIVFQDYALFPHLNVEQNMGFGLRDMPAPQKRERLNELMELTGVGGLQRRFPHELSGGQKQRIALARALAPNPSLMLFDEPFSSLDSMLRIQLREEIRDVLKKAGSTGVLVTHNTKDAMSIADRICMLKKGKNIQTGTPGELYKTPVNAYVANFFGKTNLIEAEVTERGLKTPFGVFPYKGRKRFKGENVTLSIRPESFVLKDESDDCICGVIVGKSFMGDYSEMVCEVYTGEGKREELVIRIPSGQSCAGRQCWFKPRKGSIHILSRKGEESL